MKILFVNPSSESSFKKNMAYPLGLLYMTSVLEKKGYEVKVKNYYHESWETSKKKIISIFKDFSPD